MASMFYEPCLEILKAAPGKEMRVFEVSKQIKEKYPALHWDGGDGPVRALLMSAAGNGTPIRMVQGSKPPRFYYSEAAATMSSSVQIPDASPEEIMEEAYCRADRALRDEILSRIVKMDDTSFEVLVNNLISRMGFGRAETTQASHDGGIDGYIYGDRLGLNVICVQAKRYDGHNVQRPEIDRFIGALEGRDGVFVTSSGFSPEAKRKAEKPCCNSKIALIDGEMLVGFMIEYNVGVQEVGKTYILKRLDMDYFEELGN